MDLEERQDPPIRTNYKQWYWRQKWWLLEDQRRRLNKASMDRILMLRRKERDHMVCERNQEKHWRNIAYTRTRRIEWARVATESTRQTQVFLDRQIVKATWRSNSLQGRRNWSCIDTFALRD